MNPLIRWIDVYLTCRNDMPPGKHHTMWEGAIAPCWPNIAPGDPDKHFSGCENGTVAGCIARCTQLILETPSTWNTAVPDGCPYGFGVTCWQRATNDPGRVDYVCTNKRSPWLADPASTADKQTSGIPRRRSAPIAAFR